MDEPLSSELKLPEDSNLQESNLKDDSLSEIVGTSSEPPITEPISGGLSNMDIDSLDDAGKGSSFETNLNKGSHDPLPPKESSFQVTLEPKPTEAPPLLLLDTKSQDLEDDSVFTDDLSTMPDQLLAEPPKREELDERTEHEIASNIEEQLREFDGSEDDISLDKNICVTPSIVSATLTRPEDIFGEDTSASAAGSEPPSKSDTPIPFEKPTDTPISIDQPTENPISIEQLKTSLESVEDLELLEQVERSETLEPVEDPEPLEPMTDISVLKKEESKHEENQNAEVSDPTIKEDKEKKYVHIEDSTQIKSDLPDDLMEKSDDVSTENIGELSPKVQQFENVLTEDILVKDIPTEETIVKKNEVKEIPVKEIPTENISLEEIPAKEIQEPPPSEEPEVVHLPTETSMEVDDVEKMPSEKQVIEDTAEKSSNDTIEIEDVEMNTIEDSKEKNDDTMLDSTDPLAKSGKSEDLEDKSEEVEISKENISKPETEIEKNVEDPMDEDICIVEPLSSTTIEEDAARVIEAEKTEEIQEAEKIEEGQEKEKTVETCRDLVVEEEKKDRRDALPTEDIEIIEINESDESKEMTNNDASEAIEKDSDDVQIVEIANISVEEVINSVQVASTSAEEVSQQQKDSGQPKESSTAQPEEDMSNEEVCLLPDSQKELTGAEKEQAILARENAEKEAEKEKKEKEKEKSDTRQSTPIEEIANEEDQVNEEAETPQDNLIDLAELEIKELNDEIKDDKCHKCRKAKPCKYKMLRNGEVKYLCDIKCVNSFRVTSKEAYTLIAKKVIITSIIGVVQTCVRCRARKSCGFRFKDSDQGVYIYLCQPSCLNVYIGKNVEKYLVRRKKYIVEDLGSETVSQKCIHCGEKKLCKYFFKQDDDFLHICDENCFNLLSKEEPERFRLKQRRSVRGRDAGTPSPLVGSTSTTSTIAQWQPDLKIVARTEAEAEAAKLDREISFTRRCEHCSNSVEKVDQLLHWEMLDFCNEVCLAKYQNDVGAFCYLCKTNVPMSSLGKYCVRFGFDIRQFCTTSCLERHKKGLKVCSFCQKDISYSKAGFLAPVGTRGVFKDFCSQACMSQYDEMCNPNKKPQLGECAVCNHQKVVRVEVMVDGRELNFCSSPCFSAFKFVNNIHLDHCGMCSKYFERKSAETFTIYQDKKPTVFCSKICLNIFISLNRKIVPCQWCKVKKYDFDMIQKHQGSQIVMMVCSVNCLNQQKVSQISGVRTACDNCHKETIPQYHLTMSDGTVRNFCNYNCVLVFRGQFGRSVTWTIDNSEAAGAKEVNNKKAPFPTGQPKRARGKASASSAAVATTASASIPVSAPTATEEPKDTSSIIPVISNVESLAQGSTPLIASITTAPTVPPSPPTEPVTVAKKRGRPRLNISATVVPSEQSPQQSTVQVQRQSQTKPETSEDDQPLVRLRSLRSGGGQNIQTQESPKNQHNVSITAKALTSNSHTQTKAVQKKSIGINAVLEKTSEGCKTPDMVERATMTVQDKDKPKQVTTEKLSSSTSAGVKTQVVVVPQQLPMVANKQTMCKPATATKGTSCRPHPSSVQCQTDDEMGRKILVPIPVPIYVPQPMYMYSAPFPVPVPIPLPIPVPIFIPTTRNSAEGIMKEIKKIQDKMPTDPFEAELLMMAEMVAGDKKKNESDSDSEPEAIKYEEEYQPPSEVSEPSNSFGEDVLQMALKMATECDESAVDLESAMTTNTITPPATVQHMSHEPEESADMSHQMIVIDGQRQVIRGRKRPSSPVSVSPVAQPPRNNRVPVTPPKRQRREIQVIGQSDQIGKEPVEKPDTNLCLKYTFGVNAWKQWVMTKNADLEKSSIKRKPFKSELLQLTADELNYSLCLFVKEVRKPNGSEYAPDTIYYLVLGIQQYLYENGRIDNIFTDPYYERFTDCLDEVAKKFSVLYNDSQYIVTRVEEEHLWECKQLGAHSPHVLLSTLMFFNTKHFNLTTVEEHMQLSFSHIMKHWKRSPPGTKSPGSRNVLLRFYPPQSGLEANPKKKKVYEQQENEDNPLRCPVKLYEFYLSKCPESVKTRNDVFYLQPERSCVPDSPVWYSTQPLSREALSKMLHRVKMVKEINIALLTS